MKEPAEGDSEGLAGVEMTDAQRAVARELGATGARPGLGDTTSVLLYRAESDGTSRWTVAADGSVLSRERLT